MFAGPLGLIYGVLGWTNVLLDIAGLVICIRYLRLSTAMPLLVLAFAGFSGAGFISRFLYFAISVGALPQEAQTGVSLVAYVINVAGTGALVLGLLLVFRDVRERFQFLREIHESKLEPDAANPTSGV